MSDDNADADHSEIPLLYRLVLKLPRLSLNGFSDRFQGLFWALILPTFVISDTIINLLFVMCLPFPFNLISVVLFTSILLTFILRIFLERALNTRRAIIGEGRFRWNVERAIQEYTQLLQERKRDKEAGEPP
jgi:hypothetical protein